MAERISHSVEELNFLPRKWIIRQDYQRQPQHKAATKEVLKKCNSGKPVYQPGGKIGVIRLQDAGCNIKDIVMVYPRGHDERPYPAQVLSQVVVPSSLAEHPNVSYIARKMVGGVQYISLGGGTSVQKLKTITPCSNRLSK